MSAVAYNERFRQLCVKHRGRLRAGSYNHASAWRLLDGCFGRCLDAGDERRRVRPRTRPGTRKGRTTRSSRSAGRPAGSTTGHGPSGGTASHGTSYRTASHGTSRRTGLPSPGHAAATGHGATSGAAYRLTATAPDPTFRCPAAAGGSACGSAAA